MRIMIYLLVALMLCSSAFAIEVKVLNSYTSTESQLTGNTYYIRTDGGATQCSGSGVGAVFPSGIGCNDMTNAAHDIEKSYYSDFRAHANTDVIYQGALRSDVKIMTPQDARQTAELHVALEGSSSAGRKIIIMGETVFNSVKMDVGDELGRIDLVGYTDANGELRIQLTSNRFYTVYVDSVDPTNLIYATLLGYINDDNLKAGYYSVRVDPDSPKSLIKTTVTTPYGGPLTSYNNDRQPVRISDSTGILCNMQGRGVDTDITTGAKWLYATCAVNTGKDITTEVNDGLENNNWNTGQSGVIYQGSSTGDTTFHSVAMLYYGQELEIQLNGANAANRKVIIMARSRQNSAIGEPTREELVGYTDGTGFLKAQLQEGVYYEVYVDSVTDDNLIYASLLVNNDGDLLQDYYRIEVDPDSSTGLVEINVSSATASFSGEHKPVRILDASDTVVCAAVTRQYDSHGAAYCRINTGDGYEIQRNDQWDDTTWLGDARELIYSGSIQGDARILTGDRVAFAQSVTIDLGFAYANEMVTVYDRSDRSGDYPGNDYDAERIGCQGYLDSNGILTCELREDRRYAGYLGEQVAGTKLFHAVIGSDGQKTPIVFRNHDIANSATLTMTDLRYDDKEGVNDRNEWADYELRKADGTLACSGRMMDNYVSWDDHLSTCLVRRDTEYFLFVMYSNFDVNSGDWYLVYNGKFYDDSFIRTEQYRVYDLQAQIEVTVDDGFGNPLENKRVTVTAENDDVMAVGFTKANGKVLVPVLDYSTAPGVTSPSAPQYTVSVDGGAQIPITIFRDDNHPVGLPSEYTISVPDRKYRTPQTKDADGSTVVDFRTMSISAIAGSELAPGTLVVTVLDEAGQPQQAVDVTILRAGTNTGGNTVATNAQGQATFTVDPYYGYDISTEYGVRRNTRVTEGTITRVTVSRSTSPSEGEQLDYAESRPSLLTLSGELKDKNNGGDPVAEASFQVLIRDDLSKLWYNLSDGDGNCFENKVFQGEFGFIVGGKHPLFLVEDKVYTMDIDVYTGPDCSGVPADSFTTYFKG